MGRVAYSECDGGPNVPRKPDLKQVNAVCRKFGITEPQERRFRRLMHELKAAGDGGTANDRGDFTWEELNDLAAEFLAGQ